LSPYGEFSINSFDDTTNGFPIADSMFLGIDCSVTPHSFPFISSPAIKKYESCCPSMSGSGVNSVSNEAVNTLSFFFVQIYF